MQWGQWYHDPARRGRRSSSKARVFVTFLWPVLALLSCAAGHAEVLTWQSDLIFLNTTDESASPLHWEVDADNVVHVYLIYDQERASPNRANGHWFFQVQSRPGAELTFVLHNFDNVWNGQKGSPIDKRTVGFSPKTAGPGSALARRPPTISCGSRCVGGQRLPVSGPAAAVSLVRPELLNEIRMTAAWRS
jgi:hypothetical protein